MKKKSTYYLDSGKVREAILRSGVSKEQIVERSGFGFTTLNNMQNPRYCAGQAFSMRTILAVSAAIGCKAADLLADGTNTPAPAPKPAQRAKPKQSDLFEDPAKEEAVNRLVQSWQEYLTSTNKLIDSLLVLLARR